MVYEDKKDAYKYYKNWGPFALVKYCNLYKDKICCVTHNFLGYLKFPGTENGQIYRNVNITINLAWNFDLTAMN